MSLKLVTEKQMQLVDVDPEGKFFDNVSRFCCVSKDNDVSVDTDVYQGEFTDFPKHFNMKLYVLEDAETVDTEQLVNADEIKFAKYATLGKVYEVRSEKQGLEIYISYGGLLMRLRSAQENFVPVHPNADVVFGIYD